MNSILQQLLREREQMRRDSIAMMPTKESDNEAAVGRSLFCDEDNPMDGGYLRTLVPQTVECVNR